MMKRTYNIIFATLAVAAMSLLAAGCQKQDKLGLNDGDAPLSFSVGVAGEADFEQTGSDGRATKADNRKNSGSTIDNFKVAGYADASVWFEEQTVSTSSMVYNDYIWRSGTQHTFYAYANLPASGATATIASTGVTLNYTAVPAAQASQQDILLGSYKGKGDAGKASIQFYHPLAAVAFQVGTISGVTKISSITLDGVYKSGSVNLSETSGTPAFAWTASETQNGVNQTMNVTTFSTNTKLGDPFILIPQTFSSKPLTVKIALTTAEGDKTVTATLSTGSITAGKTTTYAVNYSAVQGLNFSTPVVADWETVETLSTELNVIDALPGVFSVGSSTKVRFSKGNLYYDGGWHFENYQYDFRSKSGCSSCIDGIYNKTSGTPRGHWGLFGWVGESSTEFTTDPEKYGVSYIYEDSWNEGIYYGNNQRDKLKAEWGTAIDDKGTWRTLTYTEWQYLLGLKKSGPVRPGPYLYAKAKIKEVPGIVIFPDDYNGITSGDGIANVNDPSAGFPATSILENTWIKMEVDGVVFLPAAGNRIDTEYYYQCGSYQSSSPGSLTDWRQDPNPAAGCYILDIYDSSMEVEVYFRSIGNSVRLVTVLN